MSKLENLAETTSDLDQLAQLAEHQHVPVRYAVLNNRNVTHEILVVLSNDGNRDISETAKRLLGGFTESDVSVEKVQHEIQQERSSAKTIAQRLDQASSSLESLQSRANSFLALTWVALVAGILMSLISLIAGMSSRGGLFASPAVAFFFIGIGIVQLAFYFAVAYLFTSTMAQHASVNYHLAARD